MRRFIIERDIPQVGSLDREQLKGAAAKSNDALDKLAGKAQWQHSYVVDDKTFCIYLADGEVSAVVEQLARFRTQRLQTALLRRRGLPLALAALALDDRAEIVDLDDPRVLVRERLRPSAVATRQRQVTQPQARALHGLHPRAAALRWWSAFEASWAHYTVFDRAVSALSVVSLRELTLEDESVTAAADFLGLRR